MKKILFLALSVFLLVNASHLYAQKNKLADTLLVFTLPGQGAGDTTGFRYFEKGKKISWWDVNDARHEGTIKRLSPGFIVMDGREIPYDSITRISTVLGDRKGEVSEMAIKMSFSGVIKVQGNYQLMTRAQYERTLRRWKFEISMKQRESRMTGDTSPSFRPPGLKRNVPELSPRERFMANEQRIAWEISIRDTNRRLYDSVHQRKMYYSREFNVKRKQRRYLEYLSPHSFTVSPTELLSNQVTLTYGYRINRWMGFDFSPGLYFPTSGKMAPEITYVQHCPGFSYDRTKINGYQASLTIKFYLPTKPNRYLGLKGFGRYLYYDKETVMTMYEPYGDYAYYSLQSEKSRAGGLALLCGWQVTHFKHLTFDFYLGLGAYKRWGTITDYLQNEDQFLVQIGYITYHQAGWFPSIQAGVKLGMRFGKRQLR